MKPENDPGWRALACPYHLACIYGPDQGIVIPLDNEQIVLGRNGDIPFNDQRASRKHACVERATRKPLSRLPVSGYTQTRQHPIRPGSTFNNHVSSVKCPVITVRDLSSSNGTRVRHRSLLLSFLRIDIWHRAGTKARALYLYDHIKIAGNILEVRPRPPAPQWPEGQTSVPKRHLLSLLPLIFLPFFLLRFLNFHPIHHHPTSSHTKNHWPTYCIIAIILIALAIFFMRLLKRHSQMRAYDASFLLLATKTLRSSPSSRDTAGAPTSPYNTSHQQMSISLATPSLSQPQRFLIWPDIPAASSSISLTASTSPYAHHRQTQEVSSNPYPSRLMRPFLRSFQKSGDTVQTIGFVGTTAIDSAHWWCAQIAARTGGACIWEENQPVFVIGNGTTSIHLVQGSTCQFCSREHGETAAASDYVIHVGIAANWEQLPPWCDLTFPSTRSPVSPAWWKQICQERCQISHGDIPTTVLWKDVHSRDALPGSTGTLPVPLGKKNQKSIVWLDLVEDGPHALIAGTTGAGKSEVLITWIMGLCTQFSPEDLQLILVDYKGGATFRPFAKLPHTAALLTDLDEQETERAIRGINALVRQREQEMAALHVPDIKRWHLGYEKGQLPRPPARIVVAIDEFRVLRDSHPRTLDALVRLASQGRSLGIHLISATQKPSGALSPAMRANIDIRLALRCSDDADSMDVLGSPRAARLERCPGRAIIGDGPAFQTAWIQDLETLLEDCINKWQHLSDEYPQSAKPLWPSPLRDPITWDDVDIISLPMSEKNRCASIGIIDGIDEGQSWPLVWNNEHIRIEGPVYEHASLANSAYCIATRISSSSGAVLYVCGSSIPKHLPLNQFISSHDPASVVRLLEGAIKFGPSIIVFQNLPATLEAIDEKLGPSEGGTLFKRFIDSAQHLDMTIIAVLTNHTWISSELLSSFSMRLGRIHQEDDAIRSGLPISTPATTGEGHFIIPSISDHQGLGAYEPMNTVSTKNVHASSFQRPHLCAVPTASSEINPPLPAEKENWKAVSLMNVPNPFSRHAIGRIGDDLKDWFLQETDPLVIIGRNTQPALDALNAVKRCGMPPALRSPTPTGSCKGEAEDYTYTPITPIILKSHQWFELRTYSTHNVLALDPDLEMMRALAQSSNQFPKHLRAESWDAYSGIFISGGRAERVVLRRL